MGEREWRNGKRGMKKWKERDEEMREIVAKWEGERAGASEVLNLT